MTHLLFQPLNPKSTQAYYNEKVDRVQLITRHFQLLPSQLDRLKLLHELVVDDYRGLFGGLALLAYLC